MIPLLALMLLGDLPVSTPRDGLPNVFAKLREGKPVTVAYFGGSITAGAGSSKGEETSYRALVGKWLVEAYPKSKITNVNAAIGGTGSDLGAYRLGRDVLAKKPDLVLVEFAVNDGGTKEDTIDRSMEGIVRQIRRADPSTDVAFVYTFVVGWTPQFKEGKLVRSAARHEAIAEHYGIPSINVAVPAAAKLIDVSMTSEAFAKDGVHPTDLGYRIYADALIDFLKAQDGRNLPAKPHVIPDPLRGDSYENVRMIGPEGMGSPGPGWSILTKGSVGQFPAILTASEPGSEQSIEFSGTTIGLFYVLGPDTGSIEYQIDDRPWKPFDPFDVFSLKYARSSFRILEDGMRNGKHTLRIKVGPEHHKDSKGTAFRIGYLLVGSDARQE